MLDELVHLVTEQREAPYYAAEIGCADGVYGSYCAHLENDGWKVVCVEPNPEYAEKARAHRALVVEAACSDQNGEADFTIIKLNSGMMTAVSALKPDLTKLKEHERLMQGLRVIRVKTRTLDSIIEEAGFPRLDFLQIDVEGGELDVLKGFDIARWNPGVTQIENWYQSQTIRDQIQAHGYKLEARVGDDDVFTNVGRRDSEGH